MGWAGRAAAPIPLTPQLLSRAGGASREGSASFPPSAATTEAASGGGGLGTRELLRGDADAHLESYLILRRRNQSRC